MFLTDEIVGRKGVRVPNLQVKSGRHFLFWLIPRKETGLQYEEETIIYCKILIFLVPCAIRSNSISFIVFGRHCYEGTFSHRLQKKNFDNWRLVNVVFEDMLGSKGFMVHFTSQGHERQSKRLFSTNVLTLKQAMQTFHDVLETQICRLS